VFGLQLPVASVANGPITDSGHFAAAATDNKVRFADFYSPKMLQGG
jgi:hypothetical protein